MRRRGRGRPQGTVTGTGRTEPRGSARPGREGVQSRGDTFEEEKPVPV